MASTPGKKQIDMIIMKKDKVNIKKKYSIKQKNMMKQQHSQNNIKDYSQHKKICSQLKKMLMLSIKILSSK